MRTFPDIRIRAIVADAQRAQQLLDSNEYAQARELFTAVRTRAAKLGLDSAYLAWGIAVTSDYLGELEVAFNTICESVAKDPLNPASQHSFEVVAGHIRTTLADPARAPDDPSTPRLYQLLLGAGEADVACHVAMARHLAHEGKTAEAMQLLDAVTLLAPVSRDAWLQKAALARTLGQDEVAAECEGQAAALATAQVPFGIPATRAAC
jgi:tetratricopeptide (TPR) repeat protein